jgi:hypothetical protein
MAIIGGRVDVWRQLFIRRRPAQRCGEGAAQFQYQGAGVSKVRDERGLGRCREQVSHLVSFGSRELSIIEEKPQPWKEVEEDHWADVGRE